MTVDDVSDLHVARRIVILDVISFSQATNPRLLAAITKARFLFTCSIFFDEPFRLYKQAVRHRSYYIILCLVNLRLILAKMTSIDSRDAPTAFEAIPLISA